MIDQEKPIDWSLYDKNIDLKNGVGAISYYEGNRSKFNIK